MSAPANSGTAPASSGEVVKISRGAARSWILGHNGFLWSCKVKIYILGAFGALSPALANRSGKLWQALASFGNRILLQVNRITGQVLVMYIYLKKETKLMGFVLSDIYRQGEEIIVV